MVTSPLAAGPGAPTEPTFRSSPLLLKIGFYASIGLAFVCLGFCLFYLYEYQREALKILQFAEETSKGTFTDDQRSAVTQTLEVHMYTSKVLLQSCGLTVGMAFGFLGFGLFLIGIDGMVSTDLSGPNGLQVSASQLAPGLFVLLMATILVGICATARVPVDMDSHERRAAPGGSGDGPPPDVDSDNPSPSATNGTVQATGIGNAVVPAAASNSSR